MLAIEHASCVPLIKDTPTLILGMDVSHGSPGRSDVPSIAAVTIIFVTCYLIFSYLASQLIVGLTYGSQVVGSRSWPLISRYRAAVRTQSPKLEMIDALFKPLEGGKDDGIIRYFSLATIFHLEDLFFFNKRNVDIYTSRQYNKIFTHNSLNDLLIFFG